MTQDTDIADDVTYAKTLNSDAASPRLFECHQIVIELTEEDETPVNEEDRLAFRSLVASLLEPNPATQDTDSDRYCYKQFNEMVRSQQPLLLRHISTILYECDPVCLNYGFNDDEYDPEAISIIYELQDAKSAQDSSDIVIRQIQEWFGEDLSPYKDNGKFLRMCQRIWMVWCAHGKPRIL